MERVLDPQRSAVIIVGAGPAGISTALFLAKKGIRSTLIEKETFPRDKICGDGLSGWVVSMVRRINPELLRKLQSLPDQLPSHGVRFFAPNMKSVALPYRNAKYPNEPPGYVIRRIDFDRLLMEEAGKNPLIEVIQGVTIANFEYGEHGVVLSDITGKLCYTASMCVIATGSGSKLARLVIPGKKDYKRQATGIRQYYEGITGFHEGNFVDFYFLNEFLPGYMWVFPLPDGRANVGAGIRTDILKKRKLSLKLVVEQALIHKPHLAERFKHAHPVSGIAARDLPLGSKKVKLSGNRVLLTGDAGFLIDPFTGEGVGNAMWSGFAAAEHIENALAANRFDAAFNKKYDRFVYKKLWKELRLSAWIQRLINYPKLFNWVMNKVVAHPDLQHSLIRMIDDLGERRKLTRLSFYIKLLSRNGTT
ncbi:MAG: NAD(P)/FAD-dependent oxidoreductase [Porphyromonadaceae bacterium]|nr:MAG: NAD(P)/FAD-dependent oxidoreductase [Porphyromonadaceae bacterium]